METQEKTFRSELSERLSGTGRNFEDIAQALGTEPKKLTKILTGESPAPLNASFYRILIEEFSIPIEDVRQMLTLHGKPTHLVDVTRSLILNLSRLHMIPTATTRQFSRSRTGPVIEITKGRIDLVDPMTFQPTSLPDTFESL